MKLPNLPGQRSMVAHRTRQRSGRVASWQSSAFTILEVIVACAIFFMVAFAILEVVASGMKAAKKLHMREPDPGIILHALSLTNAFEEGTMAGDYEDIAPKMYPGYRWEAFIKEVGSNGLFQIDVLTYNDKKPRGVGSVSAQFFRPNSKPGSASKPTL